MKALLKRAGFTVHRMTFSEAGHRRRRKSLRAHRHRRTATSFLPGIPTWCPPGEVKAWAHAPFAGEIADGQLYGRGAVDMKGGIACAVAAALDYLAAHGGKPKGSISFLITGDEESIAINGTVKLVAWAAARGEKFDHCILGEPSNVRELGDTIKIGRRGSLNGILTVTGRQGHVAYPDRAENPVRAIVDLIGALMNEPLDQGSAHFQPSNLEFTSIDVGNPTVNLIPGEARARFNIRFNDCHTQASLKQLIEQRAAKAAGGTRFSFAWEPSNADVFVVETGPFTDLVAGAVTEVTKRKPELSTTGGTSDARFIKNYCPVVEFGLVGQTMHQTDERVPLTDLAALTAIYRRVLEKYFADFLRPHPEERCAASVCSWPE